MIDYSDFYQEIQKSSVSPWLPTLKQKVEWFFQEKTHGDFPKWAKALKELPNDVPYECYLDQDVITIKSTEPVTEKFSSEVESQLCVFRPWRKGPFEILGVPIDTEWRSDWKWQRVKKHIGSLEGQIVLDIGCGSGYHLWRMLGEGAKLAIGLEPMLLFVMQFYVLQKYVQNPRAGVLPLGTEDLPEKLEAFDTVFSMGLLYHRRDPLEHLFQIFNALKPGGQVVLETLVVDGEAGYFLMPEDRYAKMPNVYFLPTTKTLELWFQKMKFRDVRCCDVNQTSLEEQRSTEWMRFESLKDYLDPKDHNKTIEGYPAPKRAIFTAHKPK